MKKKITILCLIISLLLQSFVFAQDYVVEVDDIYTVTNESSKELVVTTNVILPYYNNLLYSNHLSVIAAPEFQNGVVYDTYGNGRVDLTNYVLAPGTSKGLTFSHKYELNKVDYDLPVDTMFPESYPTNVAPFLGVSKYVDVNSDVLKNRQVTLMNELPAGRRNKPYYIAEVIYDYVTQNMCYPLTPVRGDAVFAENNHVGVCEQYSYLMVGLLRLSNIPARTVSGFRFKEDELQNELTIKYGENDQQYAHMWVEAYFDGIGWVPFDPTRSLSTTKFVDIQLEGQTKQIEVYEPLDFQDKSGFAQLDDYYLANHIEFDSINLSFAYTYSLAQDEEKPTGDFLSIMHTALVSPNKKEEDTFGSYSFASGRETIVANYTNAIPLTVSMYEDVIGVDWLEKDVELLLKFGNADVFKGQVLNYHQAITREEFAKLLVDALDIPLNKEYIGFNDVVASDYEDEIQTLHYYQIINGYEDGTFKGLNPLKRSEVASILNKLLKSEAPPLGNDIIFSDMTTHWSKDVVDRIKNFGIVNGFPEDQTFRPEAFITRGQAIVMIQRYLRLYQELGFLMH